MSIIYYVVNSLLRSQPVMSVEAKCVQLELGVISRRP